MREPMADRRRPSARFVSRQVPVARAAATPAEVGNGFAVAVVGTGPRGISVLERLGARLLGRRSARPLTIYAIDADEVGSGRVWRSGQPMWLSMNNRSGEVTMFSGPADEGAWRPGAGPTFAEWWQRMDARFPGPGAYAPRSVYGRYLRFVLDVIETNLPPGVDLVRIHGVVRAIEKRGERFELSIADRPVVCDRVAVCSGHQREQSDKSGRFVATGWTNPERLRQRTTARAGDEPGRRGAFPGGATGIVGLGLTFHDVVAALTVGRGGRFVGSGEQCVYIPGGDEPDLIVAGSRSAMPIPARGVSQRPPGFRYRPRLFTPDLIAGLRATGPLDFRAQVLPWLEAEANLAFWRGRLGPDVAARLERRLGDLRVPSADVMPRLRQEAAELGCAKALSLEALARPFAGRSFPNQSDFRRELERLLMNDVAEAMRGEVDSALKAAMEVVRDVRPTVRAAVDFGGLTAASHKDFVEHIGPMLAFLSTGPSVVRSWHLLALMRGGLLEILGPQAAFTAHDGGFVGYSPAVADYGVFCADVVDARIRPPDLARSACPMTSRQRDTGAWRPHVRVGDPAFRTGGIDVTRAPYHPIATDGSVERRMYVLGIPTESTRWFMQVGIGRPGPWGEFFRDADAIAEAALAKIELSTIEPAGPVRAHGACAGPGPDDMDYCFGPQHPDEVFLENR